MDLFSQLLDPPINILPQDGEANYHGVVLNTDDADYFFSCLLNTIEWKNDEAIILDKKVVTKRKVAWYASQPFKYTYSKITRPALPWTLELLDLKHRVESISGEKFNSCLLNLYHTGDEGMSWHSDSEQQLKPHGAIASVSLGAERQFFFKHKSFSLISTPLFHTRAAPSRSSWSTERPRLICHNTTEPNPKDFL